MLTSLHGLDPGVGLLDILSFFEKVKSDRLGNPHGLLLHIVKPTVSLRLKLGNIIINNTSIKGRTK